MTQSIATPESPRAAADPWPRWRTASVFTIGLAVWFGLSAYAGLNGVFAAGPDSVFRPVLLSMAGPVAIFLAAYAVSSRFRATVLAHDMRLLTSLQHWRVVGFAFILLYAGGVLPGVFAWPAGIGDVLIGLTTPLVLLALDRRPGFARGPAFIIWNVLGLLDFVVAGFVATLASGAVPGVVAAGGLTSAPMEVWPLFLFPSFFVPLFIFAHLSVLFQLMARRREA